MVAENEARAAVLAAAKGMLERGLTSGTSGNVSARLAAGTIVITPSGLPYQDMGPRTWS
jgi:ribulose-5-phosphate 4-epimerase/fuculose-1-phosphate aldolase